MMVAVTGATGEVGGRLAAAGRPRHRPAPGRPRCVASPEAGGRGRRDRVELRGRRRDEEGAAGSGDALPLSGEEARNRLEQHKSAVDAAKAAGVKRIVYLSFYGASPDTAFTFGQDQDSWPGGAAGVRPCLGTTSPTRSAAGSPTSTRRSRRHGPDAGRGGVPTGRSRAGSRAASRSRTESSRNRRPPSGTSPATIRSGSTPFSSSTRRLTRTWSPVRS